MSKRTRASLVLFLVPFSLWGGCTFVVRPWCNARLVPLKKEAIRAMPPGGTDLGSSPEAARCDVVTDSGAHIEYRLSSTLEPAAAVEWYSTNFGPAYGLRPRQTLAVYETTELSGHTLRIRGYVSVTVGSPSNGHVFIEDQPVPPPEARSIIRLEISEA